MLQFGSEATAPGTWFVQRVRAHSEQTRELITLGQAHGRQTHVVVARGYERAAHLAELLGRTTEAARHHRSAARHRAISR